MTETRIPHTRAAGKAQEWRAARKQAKAIGETTTEAGKRRAVLLWCRKVLGAIKGGGQ